MININECVLVAILGKNKKKRTNSSEFYTNIVDAVRKAGS